MGAAGGAESSPTVAPLSPWAPLRHRIFLALFIAQMASNIGSLMQNVGSAWLMGDLGATAALVALVQTATYLPIFLLGIPSGALADIADRRRILLVTQTAMLVAALLLAVLSFLDIVTPAWILALTFALGVGAALNSPAWQAIQPDLVPRRELSQALALGALTFNVGRALGPALGGLVLAAAGPAWVFAINAASFLGTVIVIFSWRARREQTRLPAETLRGATRAALRYGLHAPLLRNVLVRVALVIIPGAALQALLPTVVRGPLGLGSGAYGLLLGCFGIGAALSAVARPAIEARVSADLMVAVGSMVLVLGLLVDGFVHIAWVVGLVLFITGFAWTTAFTTTNVAAQATLASWVRARGMGLYILVLTGGLAIGSALWGVVANWSLAGAHAVAALVTVVGLVIGRYYRLDRIAHVDVTPVDAVEPVVTLTPRPDDGPVLVTVTYRVPHDAAAQFLEVMKGVEQHRRRTGAYQWGLFRDLTLPDRYVETFHVDSWAEHLRQHSRDTVASDTRIESVRQLVDGTIEAEHFVSAYSDGLLSPDLPTSELALGGEP